MKDRCSTLPSQKNEKYGYELAYKLAREQLTKIEDIEQQCLKSGASYQVVDSRKVIIIQYLNQPYQITLPDIDISLKDSEKEVPLRDKILILHYLTLAKGTPVANKIIAYKELPEGAIYFPTFLQKSSKAPFRLFWQGAPSTNRCRRKTRRSENRLR